MYKINIKDCDRYLLDNNNGGFVYYIQLIDTTIFKIGKAKNLFNRIKQLTNKNITWCLKYFILTNDRHDLERVIHDLNSSVRIGTSELFDFSKLDNGSLNVLKEKFNSFEEYNEYGVICY